MPMPTLATQAQEPLFLFDPADRAHVRAVKTHLSGLKIPVWTSEDELIAGERHLDQWEQALLHHTRIFLFWSRATLAHWGELSHLCAMAAQEHDALTPVLLDDTPLPLRLEPYHPIAAVGKTMGEVALLIQAQVTGRRRITIPRVEVERASLRCVPGGPLEFLVVRAPITRTLWDTVLAWAREREADLPQIIVGSYAGGEGWSPGEVTVSLEDHGLTNTAVVLSLGKVAYPDIPDRDRVLVRSSQDGRWPLTAVWPGQNTAVCQVDLGSGTALAAIGPRLPVFRTEAGFTFGVLAMAPDAGDPDPMARAMAGLYADGLALSQVQLDLCLLLTPDSRWELPAVDRLTGSATTILSPETGLSVGGASRHAFLQDAPCVYRLTYDTATGQVGNCRYRTVTSADRLDEEEPALPLRQLFKQHTPPQRTPLYGRPAIDGAVDERYAVVRRTLLDAVVTEERRQEILDLLSFPAAQQPDRGIGKLARTLAKVSLGGALDLEEPGPQHTALWRGRTDLAVVVGDERAWPDRTVDELLSQMGERAGFSPQDTLVVVLEHAGVCEKITPYQATISSGPVEVSEELGQVLAPPHPTVQYCGLQTLEAILRRCQDPSDFRREVS